MENIEEIRQERLAKSLEERLDAALNELYTIRDIIENENEGYDLNSDLEVIKNTVENIIDASI